ncbi:MAG: sigma-70 family RNA polymerase sigma factor [Microscillaceae bacterium]|jgi:RNA polymerase sigma-70 factor (ECF subfamily)|nr:sigma-70 family RNA polymerase sigma factor [Microscillaceae bacterium]
MDAAQREQLFLTIVDTHKARLRRLGRAYLTDIEDLDDWQQEVFINIWNSLPNFRFEAQLSTWVYRIAVNTALTFRKRLWKQGQIFEKNHYQTQVIDNQQDTEEKLQTEARLTQLYELLNQFAKTDRLLITLALEGLSYQEMANIIGIEPNYVGVKLNRLKTKLMQMMKEVRDE